MNFVNRHSLEPSTDSSPTKRPQRLPEGRRIRYERQRYLGQGASGVVYRVTDLRTGDHLAMKVVLMRDQDGMTKEDAQRKFQKEVRIFGTAVYVSVPSRAGFSESVTTLSP
jgi:putative transposon-encoded protein